MPRLIVMRMFAGAVALGLLTSCGGGGSGTAPLTITASSPPAGTTGAVFPSYSFQATGGTPSFVWNESGPMPPGLMLNASGFLSGTPATAGTYPVSVTVTDSSYPPVTATAAVTLTVSDSAIVVAASPSPLAGTVTYPYSGGFTASGGSPPYTWRASGALPPGLMLGSDGTVSGTPTQKGSFPFSVTATDSAQTPASGPPLATQIDINNPPALALNAMPAPPAGVDGTSYGPFSFSVTGGFLPLTWSTTPNSLPPGLSLGTDGSLTGTPTSIKTFNFTVTVTDSSAPTPATSSLPFSVNITAPPAPTINAAEPLTGTVGLLYAPFQFTVSGGLAPLGWLETPLLSNGLSLSSDGILSGTPTAAGQFPITLNVTDALSQSASPVPVVVRVSLPHPGSFTVLSASMTAPRSGHTATLLSTGKVLIAGGVGGAADTSAELYNPATGAFTATGSMTEARIGHTATLLNNSARSVLIVGSVDMTAELYNPATGTFTATGLMHHARTSPTATLLSNTGPNAGKVLIVGGNTASGDLVAELYDPGTGAFTDTGSTTIARSGHTATLLTTSPLAGQVLIAGGSNSSSAELYNPATGVFTTTGDMTVARTGHTATALGTHDGAQNGDVLIVGTDGSADLYDPSKGTFARIGSLLPSMQPSYAHTASLRNDGTVLAAGGFGTRHCGRGIAHFSRTAAALFAPESDGFTATESLSASRYTHTATVLADGTVLIAGGTERSVIPQGRGCFVSTVVLSSAELFK
jgi:Putative Ig domain